MGEKEQTNISKKKSQIYIKKIIQQASKYYLVNGVKINPSNGISNPITGKD